MRNPYAWTDEQRELYSRMLRFMSENKELMTHPQMPIISEELWHTICHNSATLAADMIAGDLTILNDDESVLATTKNISSLQ